MFSVFSRAIGVAKENAQVAGYSKRIINERMRKPRLRDIIHTYTRRIRKSGYHEVHDDKHIQDMNHVNRERRGTSFVKNNLVNAPQ
jgi:hypothetical protein